MTARGITRAGIFGVTFAVLVGVLPADAGAPLRWCRRACADEIRACVAAGERRSRCRRRIFGACRVNGLATCEPDPAPAGAAGRIQLFQTAGASFDPYTRSPSAALQEWMRDHYARMLVHAPYFDARLAWYPNAWFYQDMYAVYPEDARQAPWVLRDASGNALYIPYACGGGTCPQYAGDIGDPRFRADWIARAQATAAHGYRGIFVDDVNLKMMVSNGRGELVAPMDPRLGRAMTAADWRRYIAAFAEEIRAALPGLEIVHNQVWFFAPPSDPDVGRTINAADMIELERGFNDRGIRGGGGQYGFDTFVAFIDAVHARGKGVVLDVEASWGAEYALATYLLVSSGRDLLGPDAGLLPESWWSAYEVDLGDPAGPPAAWSGLVRRDFTAGFVLVNPPDQPPRTVALGGSYRALDGTLRTSVTLGPAEGIVLQAP